MRLVGAPGMGTITALQEVYHYISEQFDRLVTLLSASGRLCADEVAAMRLRVKNCLSPKCFLLFTFDTASKKQALHATVRCIETSAWRNQLLPCSAWMHHPQCRLLTATTALQATIGCCLQSKGR